MAQPKPLLNSGFKRLRVNRDGTAIIEFALVAPMFFLMLMGIIEIAMLMFTHSVLAGAIIHGARVGKTGYSVGDRETYIRSEILRLAGNFLVPSQLTITSLNYDTYENIGVPEPCLTPLCAGGLPNVDYSDVNGNSQWDADQGTTGAGIRNRIVLYTATYSWRFFTPLIGRILGTLRGGRYEYDVTAVTTVKNEAF